MGLRELLKRQFNILFTDWYRGLVLPRPIAKIETAVGAHPHPVLRIVQDRGDRCGLQSRGTFELAESLSIKASQPGTSGTPDPEQAVGIGLKACHPFEIYPSWQVELARSEERRVGKECRL